MAPLHPHRRMRPFVMLLVACLVTTVVAGCTDDTGSVPPITDPAPPDAALVEMMEAMHGGSELRFETDHGTIRLLLYEALLPQTTRHIAALADSGFYDGTIIHRVVDEFVIQGGDPSETGALGSGEMVPFERDPRLLFGAGALGLARDLDPDSGDSQWFITEKPAPHLSDASRSRTGAVFGTYALFGQVIDGMDIVRDIAGVPVIPGLDRPVDDVHVIDASIEPYPADLHLLGTPQTLRIEDDGPQPWILQRPLFLVAGHPFTVVLHYDLDDGAEPLAMHLRYTRGDTTIDVPLVAHPEDSRVLRREVTLPEPGSWNETVIVGDGSKKETVEVVPWHDDYLRYVPADPPAGTDPT